MSAETNYLSITFSKRFQLNKHTKSTGNNMTQWNLKWRQIIHKNIINYEFKGNHKLNQIKPTYLLVWRGDFYNKCVHETWFLDNHIF